MADSRTPPAAQGAIPLLELRSVTKTFPGTKALDSVSITANGGEILAILGENGAGKSTLMKILSGVWPAGSFEGEIRIGGSPRSFADIRDAFGAGIAMIHQELAVFRELTVAEHLELDRLPRVIDWPALFARAQKFLDPLGFGLRAEQKVGELPVGGRQLVEIARALYRRANVLVFDEPTSALTDTEVLRLYSILDRLRAEGKSILYISHRMDEIFRLADRMVILRDGKCVGELSAWDSAGRRRARSEMEPEIIRTMVGRPIEDIYPPRNLKFGEELLRTEKLRVVNPRGRVRVDGLSFSVRRGEIVGMAGLLGAGRSDSLDALFGVLHPHGPRGEGWEVTGEVFVRGKPVEIDRPGSALGLRMAYVSEDRKGSGLVLGHSIADNLILPALSASGASVAGSSLAGSRGPWARIRAPKAQEHSSRWADELRVKRASLDQAVGTLSGGNQQKVVLGKWLMTEPEILFLDEPTRGIDVGAKGEIYQWIQKLAAEGLAIVMASSEMPELLGVCHRILVLREGHLSAELSAAEATQEAIMKAASL